MAPKAVTIATLTKLVLNHFTRILQVSNDIYIKFYNKMACNENVIKNMANEITRNCQSKNVTVDTDFVIYLIDLLLLNPKYGRLFSKTINRNNLEFFVNDCVNMLTGGATSINTLKMQFVMQTNYDKIQNLIDKHLDSIDQCLRPLTNEILEEDPDLNDDAAFKKLFRKISIYIILSSGLGNPGSIVTLKEGMAALESVFSLEDLKAFVALPRSEKVVQLNELMEITSGIRLFNRDCKKGGEGIPDLPFNLVDAGKACVACLSSSLIAVMQRVNTLGAAAGGAVVAGAAAGGAAVAGDGGDVAIHVPAHSELTENDYKQVFELLAFNRQYELYIRRLLSDAEGLAALGARRAAGLRGALAGLHAAVRGRAAVPAAAVFPLFKKLWQIWRSMQNVMFVMSTANKIMSTLAAIQDQKLPYDIIDKMLDGRDVVPGRDRAADVSAADAPWPGAGEHAAGAGAAGAGPRVQFLGFCALCLTVGALVPSNIKIGLIKSKGRLYGFCNVKMAATFSKDPQRYINQVLEYARNNPHVINLLDIMEEVDRVRNVEDLVTKVVPKIEIADKDIQTETHPIDGYIEKNYTWDMWEWKRRACQWANIVNCRTHSTQTHHSHMRRDARVQATPPRRAAAQTARHAAAGTRQDELFLWGLRGQSGCGQHSTRLCGERDVEREKSQVFTICSWPCDEVQERSEDIHLNNTF